MHLVIDTNILIAAVLKDSLTRGLIFDERFKLSAPEFVLSEVRKILQQSRIRRRLHLNEKELGQAVSLISSQITFFPEQMFLHFIKKASKLVSHVEDTSFIALALALKIPLWSNDTELRKQSSVIVYSTKELLEIVS